MSQAIDGKARRFFDHVTIRNAAIVLLVLSVYLFLFSILLPQGINQVFTDRSWRRFLTAAILLFGWLYVRGGLKLSAPRSADTARAKPPVGDPALILLPMTPIVQYILHNQDTLSLFDALSVVAIFVALSLFVCFVVPYFLGRFVSRPLLMIASLALVFMIVNMASLAERFSWHLNGSLNVQLAVFAAVFSICFWLYKFKRELVYVVVGGFFVSGALMSALAVEDDPVRIESLRLHDLTAARTAERKPDIYLLTYDSYVENETMLQYGIDNSAQEAYLREQGFQLYRGMYSIGASTYIAMGNVLSPGGDIYQAVSGDGDVQRTLKRQGYETHGVYKNDFFYRYNDPSYDHNYPPAISPLLLWIAVFEGEFRFNVGLDNIAVSTFLDKKRALMRSAETSPRFLYTHTGPRHSQNSGVCLDNETELFEERLKIANLEMKEDVEAILSSGRDAIIIVNGDHGPYLTRNCQSLGKTQLSADDVTRLDIQDRLGAFLAIRWPDREYPRFDRMTILQDVFPAILAYMFDDESLLNGKMEATVSADAVARIAGVTVENGMISGGVDSGEPLFESTQLSTIGSE